MDEVEEVKDIQEIQPEERKRKSLLKRFFKIILYIVVGFIAFNVLLYVLLSIPFIQQRVADFAVNQLKSKLQTEVSIEEVRLSLFNNATLKGVYVEDQAQDTLLYAKYFNVKLSPWELIKNNKLEITGITLDNFLININKKDSLSDFNFQFIVDAFASTDTIDSDTTKSSLVVQIKNIAIERGRLNYNVLADTLTPGIFNASHISMYDLKANLDLNSIDPDRMDIALNSLSVKEKTGLDIQGLKANLLSEKDKIWLKNLFLSLPQSHIQFADVYFNQANNQFSIDTDDVEIYPADLVCFLPNLKFLTQPISLKTSLDGKLPALNIKQLSLNYGTEAQLEGSAFITDYAKYGTSDLNLSIDKLRMSPLAVTSFARIGDSTFVTPDIVKQLGDLYLKGELKGSLASFKLDLDSWGRQGALALRATGGVDTTFTNFSVVANLQTRNFALGRLIGGESDLGALSMQVDLRASQNNKMPLAAQMKGAIDLLEYKKQALKNIPFSGFYNSRAMGLTVDADLPAGTLYADVSMTQAKIPDIAFKLDVGSFKVDRFYKNEDWVNPRLTFALNGNLKGIDIDNMTGDIVLDSIAFRGDNFKLEPDPITLSLTKQSEQSKSIRISSPFLSANIDGQYTFATLSDEFEDMMHGYLPSVFPKTKRIRKYQNDFQFSFTAQNTEELGQLFALPLDVMEVSQIKGRLSTIDKQFWVDGDFPYLRSGETDIKNIKLHMVNADSAFNIAADAGVLMNGGVHNLSLKIDGADDRIHSLFDILSNGASVDINGKIEALAQFSRNPARELVSELKVIPSTINVDKLKLGLLPAEIRSEANRIKIHNFGISVNGDKYFGLEGVASNLQTDTLKAYFDHAELGTLLSAFDIKHIQACVHGDVFLTNVTAHPALYTKGFEVADIVVFKDTLGTINLESQWSEDYGGVKLQASMIKGKDRYADIDGIVYTKEDYVDVQVRLEKFPLSWMQPFVSDMLNKLEGSMSTNLMIEGSTKAPQIRGFLGFNDTKIGVDYTNVVYTISDTIRISPEKIGLENLTLKDSQGNTATANASVTHKNFDNLKYNLDMRMNKLMVLNTVNRTDSLFYGKVFASGSVKIVGTEQGIDINMQVKNEKNSQLNVLIPQRSEASDYQSVVYINVPEDKLDKNKNLLSTRQAALPLRLKVRLEVTPDMMLGVVIDPATGDAMQVKGNGIINFAYDMKTENMTTYGDYSLTDGNVKLNLQNLKKLSFTIKQGSKLFFVGDPLKTKFDITAYRRVKADLKTLDSSFGVDQASKIQVDCMLGINGNIDKMDLTYNIVLPSASDDIKRKFNTYISTDEQRIKQFAYLVAFGYFYSSGGSSGANFSDGLWTNLASSALSSGLNSVFGNMLGDKWQVGTNIESNDGTLNDLDVSVNVSTKFLDDKLKLSTNVGYRTDHSSTDNSIIGDFDLEYELSRLWTLRAYNHTNDKYYRQAPMTQGVGIVYTKEASTLKRLFQSFKRRKRRPQNLETLPVDSLKAATPVQPHRVKIEEKELNK